MPQDCNSCPTRERVEAHELDSVEFKTTVVMSLQNIEKTITERKTDWDVDKKDIWGGINSLRDDIKGLYWKVAFISGVCSAVTSIAVGLSLNG